MHAIVVVSERKESKMNTPVSVSRRSFVIGISTIALGTGSMLAGCSGSGSASGSGQSAGSATPASTTEKAAASSKSSAVTAKASIGDYTWEELSEISKEICTASDRDAVAKKYNLLNSNGKLDGTQKRVISDDYDFVAILMGYDENGLAFISDTAWAEWDFGAYGWYGDKDGYDKSYIRQCLNDELYELVPSNLKSVIKSVSKQNFTGTATNDKLWIPSLAELGLDDDYENSEKEGPVYKLFGEASESEAGSLLRRTFEGKSIGWWTRSLQGKEKVPKKSSSDYMVKIGYVSDGKVYSDLTGKSNIHGVVPCFYV